MKRFVNYIYKVLMTVVLSIAATNSVTAQEYVSTPVEISKEKVKIDGKVCYSHVVLEKQTLYSICKAYEVSAEDIYQLNPTLKENGLKKNSIIIIPSKETVKEVTKEAVKPAQPQEKVGNIVSKKTEKSDQAHKKQKATRIHIAKWYEDLDVIAEQYGVSADDIIKANDLKGRKLSKRQKLIIPFPGEEIVQIPQTETEAPVEEKTEAEYTSKDTVKVNETEVAAAIQDEKIDATLILPLTNDAGEPNRNNMDLYSGALLAIYDLAEKGINCNLNVFDLMDKNAQFSTDIIKNSDVVIGPISAGDLTKIFYSAPGAKAIVSPLDPRAERLVKEHPEMIHVPTPHVSQYKDLVKWMEEDFREGDKVVMITEKGARQSNITIPVKEALDSSSLAYSAFSYSILEGRDVTEPLIALMSTAGANRIIVASESEAFVNDVVRNLNLLIYNNLEIVLYAPSKVRGFETIEVENFHNTTMHVSLGYHIDYESPEVKAFLKKYRALYNTEPTQFAFQGYDIARYFMELSAKYGENWKEHLCDSPKEMLQSTFRFTKQGSGGHTNSGIRRIIYEKGYNIKRGHL
jgi:LysM repeat protein